MNNKTHLLFLMATIFPNYTSNEHGLSLKKNITMITTTILKEKLYFNLFYVLKNFFSNLNVKLNPFLSKNQNLKITVKTLFSAILLSGVIFSPNNTIAQCTNTSSYLTNNAPTVGNAITLGTDFYRGSEYTTINSVVSGNTYLASTNRTTETWITVRSGSSAGPVVAWGQTPLLWTATSNGSHYIHYNTNSSCGTSGSYDLEGFLACLTTVSSTSCSGNFYDSGGSGGNYSNTERRVWKFYPNTPGGFVRLTFSAFNTENNYDGMLIFNGTANSSAYLPSASGNGSNLFSCPQGAYRGSTSPGTITSTAPDGSLTVVFLSDGGTISSGWAATVSCYVPCVTPPTPTQVAANITVGPVRDGNVAGLGIPLLADANLTGGDGTHSAWWGRLFNPLTAGTIYTSSSSCWLETYNYGGTPATDWKADLGSIKNVNGVILQGRSYSELCTPGGQYTTKVNVQVSTDNVAWTNMGDFDANINTHKIESIIFPNKISGRYVRIGVVTGGVFRADVISIPCGTGPHNVSVSAELPLGATNIRWYDAPTGGTLLGTGMYLTRSISQNTTFYAAAYNGAGAGCESTSRLAVTAVVGKDPATPSISASPLTSCYTPITLSVGSTDFIAEPRTNLVAHYPFNGNLNDISGRGLNFTGTGNFNNGGLNLTGTTFSTAVTDILNTDNHTISFYLKYITPFDNTWGNTIFGYKPTGTDRSPTIWKMASANQHHWQYRDGANTLNSGFGDGLQTYQIGKWYQVVGVKNGANFSLYIDGVLMGTGTVADPKFAGSAALQIGSSDGTIIRDLKIFNRSTSSAEITDFADWKWYSGSCGGTLVGSGPQISVNPAVTTEYFVRGKNVCGESACVSYTINVLLPPVAQSNQSFCGSPTVADLTATGTSIKWYANATGGSPLLSTTALVSGSTYYASQTVSGCESVRKAVVYTLSTPSTAPTASSGGGNYCHGNVINLTQSGGTNGTNAVNVWYAASGQTVAVPADCPEGFMELWNQFKYENGGFCYYLNNNTSYNLNNGIINLEAQTLPGGDPFIWMYPLPNNTTFDADTYKHVNVRYKVTNYQTTVPALPARMSVLFTKHDPLDCGTSGAYTTSNYQYPFSEAGLSGSSGRKDIINDGQWHVVSFPYTAVANWNGDITGLRLDYYDPSPHNANNGSTMEVDFITVSKHPMIGEGASITLTPGDEYYPTQSTTYYAKKVDNCGSSGCKTETVILPPITSSLAANNESATCNVLTGEKVHFYHSSGRLITTVKATSGDLGSTTATAYVEAAPLSVPACEQPTIPSYFTATMARHWMINPTTQSTATVFLPFLTTEYNSLVTSANGNSNVNDNIASESNIKLSKYSGPANVNSSYLDNCVSALGSGGTTLHTQVSNGAVSTPIFMRNIATAKHVRFDITSFSEFWLHGSISSPLPVKLTNFSATCAKNVTLSWTTASEQNSDRFIVEKSRDGENWSMVGQKIASGNTNTTINYTLIDENNWNDITYYRLKQIDFNGAQEVYGPISVSCSENGSNMTVYPNPNDGKFTVEIYSNETHADANLTITDLTGKIITSQKVNIANGTTQILMDHLELQMGTYLVTLQDDNLLSIGMKPVKVMVSK